MGDKDSDHIVKEYLPTSRLPFNFRPDIERGFIYTHAWRYMHKKVNENSKADMESSQTGQLESVCQVSDGTKQARS